MNTVNTENSTEELTPSGKMLLLGTAGTFYYFSMTVVLAEVFVLGMFLGAYLHNIWLGMGISFGGLVLCWFEIVRKVMHWTLFVSVMATAIYLSTHIGRSHVPLAIITLMGGMIFLLAVNYEFFLRVPNLVAHNAKGALYEDSDTA